MSRRLSTFFTGSHKDASPERQSPISSTPSDASASSGKLPTKSSSTKLSKSSGHDRVPSSTLAPPPTYPVPSPTLPDVGDVPTIQTVAWNTDAEVPLPPPPTIPQVTGEYGGNGATGSPIGSRPGSRPGTPTGKRSGTPIGSRPGTPKLRPQSSRGLGVPEEKEKKRKSWFGSSSKSKDNAKANEPLAWVVAHQGKVPYNMSLLLNAEKVPELWDEEGDTFVYLFPRTSGKGPSFRVDSSTYSSSGQLTSLIHGHVYASPDTVSPERRQPSLEHKMQHLAFEFENTPPHTPEPSVVEPNTVEPGLGEGESSTDSKGSRALSDPLDNGPTENHLYLPLKLSNDDALPHPSGRDDARFSMDDIQTLVSVRNLFAFMLGQSLVATEKRSSLFSIFMNIAEQLRHYGFTNLDGSTYGETAAASFDSYIDELNLADVRTSREKTIEAIVLGERMRSMTLYNEGFVHGVGKYEEITKMKNSKFPLISPKTQNRLERGYMDLEIRQKSVADRLTDFEFHSVFSGIANSKMADERKMVKFDIWKTAFIATRKHIVTYYKNAYGSWPPKASSKKNSLETSGLNRLVQKDIYRDFCELYDLLVDRKSLTTRSADAGMVDGGPDTGEPVHRALRSILDEYDRSVPPYQPPVPFDVPNIPTLASTRKEYGKGDAKKDAKLRGKRLKDDEINEILKDSYNQDSLKRSPFLLAFYDLERRTAHNRTLDDLIHHRAGQWIFMYAVLQSLPMLVVDAPGLRNVDGVEYFCAIPPRSGVPWGRTDTNTNVSQSRAWYGVAGGTGVVSLPSDVVEHGVEGVFRRSHCWSRATEWTAGSAIMSAAVAGPSGDEPLPPPPTNFLGEGSGSRPGSRGSSPSRHSAIVGMGLERMPMPANVMPSRQTEQRPTSSRGQVGDPSKTFDSILGTTSPAPEKEKKGKKR